MNHAARTSIGYAIVGVAWILLSDDVLGALAQDIEVLRLVGLVKGIAFVLASAGILYWAVWRQTRQQAKLRSLQLLEAICRETTDAIYAVDTGGHALFVNDALCKLIGRPRESLLDTELASSLPANIAGRLRQGQQHVMAGAASIRGESMLATADGGIRHLLDTLGPLHDPEGHVIGVFGISRDITERKRAEDQHRQWAMAFENTRDGVIITDPRSRIVAVNRAFTEITGLADKDVIGQTPRMLRSGQHGAEFYSALWKSLNESGYWQGEIWNRRRNGEVYPEWLTISAVRDEQGTLVNFVGVFTDITRLKRSEAEVQRLVKYDPLTGLPNRQQVHEKLTSAIQACRHGCKRVAVLAIDLDGFKTVNDSLGHPAGDELLIRIAGRLRSRLHEGDLLSRLGGDEFLVMIQGVTDIAEISLLATRLLQAVSDPVRLSGGHDAYVTASIGISIHPDDGSATAVEMLRDADAAMYRAKDEGRNRFRLYTLDLHARAVSKLDTEAALSRAMERRELLLHYQPQVGARDGHLAGVEALLRWQRGGELVPPGQFIPLAENSSLMLDIGAWVIDEACRQMRAWMDASVPVPVVAVNISARQFAAGNLDAVLDSALRRHGVPAERIQLELTESMLVEREHDAEPMLAKLKSLGVSLALDDFGTGYSNLGYLQRFPIDTLKIDQSFVRRLGEVDGATLVDAIIGLAHRLGLLVVAEGCETEAQCSKLRDSGCDELQGYYFSRPVPAAQLELAVSGSKWAVSSPPKRPPSLVRV